METSVVTRKGQVVIPSRIRRKYKIKGGTKVQFLENGETINIMPITAEFIRSKAGFMGTKGKLLKLLMEEKKKEREL
jgi:AbrB family looped-hinge helix DNA binding protein